MRQSSRNLDRLEVTFDDPRAVANGGLVLPMTLADRLGLKELVDKNVHLGDAPGHANVGQKAMALVASALVGGDSIDDAGVLRTGRADALLGRWVPAPSTLGTFLRSFSWADARSLDKVAGELLKRAWEAGAGPGDRPLTVDVGSTICPTYGLKKEGGNFRLHQGEGPPPPARDRSRPGARRAPARGQRAQRQGSRQLPGRGVQPGAFRRRHRPARPPGRLGLLRKAIDKIPEEAWTAIPYWAEGGADVAETTYRAFGTEELRLVVRRVKPTPGSQLALFEAYEYHAFVTDMEGSATELDAYHRAHAEVELVIRDLKEGPWAHMPSGRFGANAAWLALGAIAYNLARWCSKLGGIDDYAGPIAPATLRRRHIAVPGHLSRSGRRRRLHLVKGWPWAEKFLVALGRLRSMVPLLA
jgi:hypothetical protein